jgi:hypothetical protein
MSSQGVFESDLERHREMMKMAKRSSAPIDQPAEKPLSDRPKRPFLVEMVSVATELRRNLDEKREIERIEQQVQEHEEEDDYDDEEDDDEDDDDDDDDDQEINQPEIPPPAEQQQQQQQQQQPIQICFEFVDRGDTICVCGRECVDHLADESLYENGVIEDDDDQSEWTDGDQDEDEEQEQEDFEIEEEKEI